MSRYQARLQEATAEEVLSQLDGPEGLFAVTRSELIYIDDNGVQRAPLRQVRRVTSRGGELLVMGDGGPLIRTPVKSFQIDELRLFFESVKTFAARSRQEAPPPPPQPAPAPAAPASEPSATVEEALTDAQTAPEEAAPDPAPTPPPPAEEGTAPPRASRDAARPARPTRLLLKLIGLATLGVTAGWVATHPEADPLTLAGVAVVGLGLAAMEWHVSEIS